MHRYRATLSYDGADFAGFQRQGQGARTVQGELEGALGRIGWSGRSVTGAGRTDRGVHALGQVVAFELEWSHSEGDLLKALNANLPADVAILELGAADPDFHPRFSARSRRYRYTIYNSPIRQPLRERYAWRVWPEMSLPPLEASAAALPGEHDFGSFGTSPESGGHTIRRVLSAGWRHSPGEGQAGDWWIFEIEAEAFLYRMVRNLVGAMKQVATGELTPDDFRAILAARRREASAPPAPACGLCLVEAKY